MWLPGVIRGQPEGNCLASGVARAFPGGRAAHPEDQNEEENEEKLRKNDRSYRKMRKDWGNHPILPAREWEASYGPVLSNAYRAIKCSQCYRALWGRRWSSEEKKRKKKPNNNNKTLHQTQLPNGGGGEYSVPKTLLGRPANMGSKISLLINQWPLLLCKIWYMNKSILENFIKIEKKWLKFKKILKKKIISGKLRSKFGPKVGQLV